MKFSNLDQLRVLAGLTGVLLALAYLGMAWFGFELNETLAMLTVGVAGFGMFFFTQDVSKRWRRRNG